MAKGLKKSEVCRLASNTEGIPQEQYNVKSILREHNKIPYQKMKEGFNNAQYLAVVQATGTGKSFLAIQWLVDNLKEGEKAIYLAPNANIANQFNQHIKECGKTAKLKEVKQVLYPSLKNEVDAMLESSTDVQYIVADEFHRLGAPKWVAPTLVLFNKAQMQKF